MKIIDNTGKSTGPYCSVTDAKYIDDYRLLISFNDGISRLVDFGEFLRKSPHPDVKKYLDLQEFKSFHIAHGDLMWGDFDLIFPIATLHDGGKIHYTPPNTLNSKDVKVKTRTQSQQSRTLSSTRRRAASKV